MDSSTPPLFLFRVNRYVHASDDHIRRVRIIQANSQDVWWEDDLLNRVCVKRSARLGDGEGFFETRDEAFRFLERLMTTEIETTRAILAAKEDSLARLQARHGSTTDNHAIS